MRKIKNKIKELWYGLFGAMKITEEETLKAPGVNISAGVTINQEVHDKRVSTALLAGKETQEVKELRYRTYAVDREAQTYEVFSPTLAMKKDELEKQDTKFIYYDDSDGLEVITIQNNFPLVETIEESLEQVGNRGKRTDYWIKIEREFGFMPRYRLEEYTKRLVVKEKTKGKTAIIEFYVSKYPYEMDLKSKGFVKEIEKVMNDKVRSDVLDINIVSFTTNHAYKVVDMLLYTFKVKELKGVSEYDGHYVIRYLADIIVNGQDRTDQYYNEEMANKYKNKAKKEVVHDLTPHTVDTVYVCEECGKEVKYCPQDMDNLDPSDEINDGSVTEFFDLQISERTFGKKLCKKCLERHLNELENLEKHEQESNTP